MDGENTGWQEPPLPEQIKSEDTEPRMSEAATLGGIFFDPGSTFEDLRRKPRFVMALLISIVLATTFSFAFSYKLGDEGIKRFFIEQLDKNDRTASLDPEAKQSALNLQLTIMKVVRFAVPVFFIIITAIGALLYWGGAKAFGGTGNFMHAVSVWVYSSFPPLVIGTIANLIILVFKSADDIDFAVDQRGLLHANPSMFLDGKSMPVIATLASTLDLFMIWGWVLAAIGLRKTNKLSSGSAWAIVIILALLMIVFRVIGAAGSGNVN
ncbi:MAG: YIP1 family protein [Acidobacteria bacterium]|nr:YIP1 family protein [Acidobacteriota bacterium]